MPVSRIHALRKEMEGAGADLCLVTSADAHQSEYPGEYDKVRAWLSGFTGSAGTLLVGAHWAGLWTDGRYFLQAEENLIGTGITLYRAGEPGVPGLEEELFAKLPEGGVLVYDGFTVSRCMGETLRNLVRGKGGMVEMKDLPGRIWKNRPPMAAEKIWEVPEAEAGCSRTEKLAKIREALAISDEGTLFLVSSLDSIAWTLNLRGSDVACNPVFLSYLLIGEKKAWLFTREGALSGELAGKLYEDGIIVCPYEQFLKELGELADQSALLTDKNECSEAVYAVLEQHAQLQFVENPVTAMKAVKNETEIRNMIEAHRKDGIALTHFLFWLKQAVKSGAQVTEVSAAQMLETFRGAGEGYLGPSFTTIAAYGPHGAIVHYSADETTDALLKPEGFFLLDSGGQYRWGTTDVTRTVVLGPVTDEEKTCYTAVLKGMLALGDAVFPHGTTGVHLDYLGREPLYRMGLDYRHGTGHGVGFLLNVHEGPNSIRFKPVPGKAAGAVFEPGMVTSDEPGVYLAGKFGVRIENLVLCENACESEYGSFMKFRFLTMVPIDREAIDPKLLGEEGLRRLNAYHKMVYETISDAFEGEEKELLKQATAPILQ